VAGGKGGRSSSGSDHYNHYQLPSADNELNNGADKWRRPERRPQNRLRCIQSREVRRSEGVWQAGGAPLQVHKCVWAEGRKRRPEAETESLIKRKHFAFWLRASRAKAAS